MAEESGDKTEAPTPRRRQEAREQGNVAKSADLTAACLLLGIMFLLSWQGPKLIDAMKNVVGLLLGADSLHDLRGVGMRRMAVQSIITVAIPLAPVMIGVVVIVFLANIIQIGFLFNVEKLQPNLAALNPIGGLGKLFKGPGFVHFGMNLLKLTLVSLVAYSAIHGRIEQIVSVQQLEFMQIFALGASIVYAIAIRIGVLLLILAIIDYAYQRYHLEQELKMSKQEIKEEMRRMDGDPKIKQRRRQIQYQIAKKRLQKEVPKADVVVTNPTEFAIALQYDADTMRAPKVIAKGQDLMAKRIREIAIEHGIPIIERKPLARALYKMCDVGQEIPEQFYSAVAEIIAYVYELTGKFKRKPMPQRV